MDCIVHVALPGNQENNRQYAPDYTPKKEMNCCIVYPLNDETYCIYQADSNSGR